MRHSFVRSLAGQKDPNFKNVTLLLHGDGTNGGQNNTFLDSGPNNLTVTMSGGVTQGTFSPYGDRWSNYFDGTGDYLNAPDNAAFAFGTGDFTIEYWIYAVSFANSPTIIDTRSNTTSVNGFSDYFNATGNYLLFIGNATIYTSTSIVSRNVWTHIAVSRSGTSLRVFINGAQDGSTVTNSTNFSNQKFLIGSNINLSASYANAYISNVRAVKGTAVYTSNFSVPTSPLSAIANTSILTCQSNRFRDASSNNFTITRNGDVSVQRFSPFSPDAEYRTDRIAGSGYFSSTFANYLAVNSATVNPGANPFTVESWVYYLGGAWKSWYGIASGVTYYIHNGNLSLWSPAGVNVLNVSVPTAAWTHIAVTRDLSNNLRAFVNGVLGGTVAISGAYNHAIPVIGERYGNGEPFFGYISGFRLLIGSAIYTSNFTVPTTPPAIINDTRWIVNFANSRIIDNSMMSNLQTVGNAQISTSIKKYGTGSLYFDGTGDYLTVINNPTLSFGTGDFTIEAWVYIAANSTADSGGLRLATIFGAFQASGTPITNSYGFGINGNSTTTGTGLYFSLWQSGTNYVVSATATVSQSTWHHVAVARSGTLTKLFLNGSEVGSGTLGNQNITTTFSATVGRIAFAGYLNELNGYIDDLRVTNGLARYTSNFTPPTAPFPDF